LPKEENDVYKWLVKSNKPYALDWKIK
jgi:hypothetical protein